MKKGQFMKMTIYEWENINLRVELINLRVEMN